MKTLPVFMLIMFTAIGSIAHAHDSRLEERVDRLASLSSSIARDARRAGIYGSLYLDAEQLARDARRLQQALRNNRNSSYIDIRFRDIERRYERFDRRYRALNSRHRHGNLYPDYTEIGAIFGDIRLIYREPASNYRGTQHSFQYGYSQRNSHPRRGYTSTRHRNDSVHSRRGNHQTRGGKRFDREDSRRNHFRH